MFESTQNGPSQAQTSRNNCPNPDPFSGSAFHHDYFVHHVHVPHDRYRVLRGRVVDSVKLGVIWRGRVGVEN